MADILLFLVIVFLVIVFIVYSYYIVGGTIFTTVGLHTLSTFISNLKHFNLYKPRSVVLAAQGPISNFTNLIPIPCS